MYCSESNRNDLLGNVPELVLAFAGTPNAGLKIDPTIGRRRQPSQGEDGTRSRPCVDADQQQSHDAMKPEPTCRSDSCRDVSNIIPSTISSLRGVAMRVEWQISSSLIYLDQLIVWEF